MFYPLAHSTDVGSGNSHLSSRARSSQTINTPDPGAVAESAQSEASDEADEESDVDISSGELDVSNLLVYVCLLLSVSF